MTKKRPYSFSTSLATKRMKKEIAKEGSKRVHKGSMRRKRG